MCRNIRVLRAPQGVGTFEECQAAARQYVRKVSGFQKPSRANEEIFERAVEEIAQTTFSLIQGLQIRQPVVRTDP